MTLIWLVIWLIADKIGDRWKIVERAITDDKLALPC